MAVVLDTSMKLVPSLTNETMKYLPEALPVANVPVVFILVPNVTV